MIDRKVYVINGWKLEGRNIIGEIINDLENINEDYRDDLDGYIIEDTMCWQYFYFGIILDRFNPDEEDGFDIVLNEKLFFDGNEKYKTFLSENTEYAEVFKKYSNNEPPQAIVCLKVW